MNSRHTFVLLTLTMGLALSGCSSHHGGPDDARMSQLIVRQFNREFGDRLVQVERMHEFQGHAVGKDRYIALVHFRIRFTRSLAEVRKQEGDSQAMELRVLFGDFKADDTKSMTDEVLFQKTDQGWMLIDSKQRK